MIILFMIIKLINFMILFYFILVLLFYDNKKIILWLFWEYYVVFMDLELMEMFVIFFD